MLSNHLILWHPFLLLPSIFPSIRVFSNELALHIRWPKFWSFSISPSNEYSGLISFKIDWSDLFAVQGTFKSFFQHPSSKHHFFGTQPSYGPTLTSRSWSLAVLKLILNQWFSMVTVKWKPMSRSTLVFHLGTWNISPWPKFNDQEIACKMWFLHICRNTGISENMEPFFLHGNRRVG